MESIRRIYKIGHGPSSSHTMGPRSAAETFLEKHKDAKSFAVTLYGSLAATGKGHLTNIAIREVFEDRELDIHWRSDKFLRRHPNGMKFEAFNDKGDIIEKWFAFSVGGGDVVDEHTSLDHTPVYDLQYMDDILTYCNNKGYTYWQYVEEKEGPEIWDFLSEVWDVMQKSVKNGINTEGTLAGGLKLPRKASQYYLRSKNLSGPVKKRAQLFSYALAVSEENAGGGKIVTAPTCGSAGTLPAVLYWFKEVYKTPKDKILKALATAGIFGNIVKYNASISGAEVGCQGEIGTACAMAAAAATQLEGGSLYQIEYAAEMGIEHHLGLTCDPVLGLVQIPCIERNVFAATRAMDNSVYATISDGKHRISFDEVTATLKATGLDMSDKYRETALGGLALQDAFPVIY
jgi:L-serine dehydratase